MIPALARLAVCAVFAILIAGLGLLAFGSSIHNPNVVMTVVQWVALPLFRIGFALDVLHSEAMCWVAMIASWLLLS